MITNDENEDKSVEERPDGANREEDPDCDNEAMDDSEDLEQKKQEMNKFSAEGNSAHNQIFIQDIGTGGFTVNYYAQKMKQIGPELPVEKKYDLLKTEDCIEFVTTFKNSEYFTAAVILCIFEAVALWDLPDLQEKLKACLPQEVIYNEDGNVVHTTGSTPYIALNSILAVISGKKFETDDGQQCVSLGGNSLQVLINILEQFPALRKAVAELLVQMTQESKYHTAFYDCQLAISIAGIISLKLSDIRDSIMTKLYENPDNVYMLGALAFRLYMGKREKEADEIVGHWLRYAETWLWRPACLCYALLEESGGAFPPAGNLERILAKKVTRYNRGDMDFISELLMQSKSFRTMLCRVLCNVYGHMATGPGKKRLAQTYINLIRYSYYKVNPSYVELPLVACDTRQQQELLTDIFEKVMVEYRLRKRMYAILKAYLKEMSQYEFTDKTASHIAAFFYNMTLSGKEYEEDIVDFLKECHSKAAKQVLNLLHKTKDKKGEIQ